jgi:hypothetical protein
LYLGVATLAIALALAGPSAQLNAQQVTVPGVSIGNDDIGGAVTGANGPEAGVWVIAETADLPTKFAKMVVTDDQGRFVIPDLPKAKFKVWVRGYGLVDSPKVDSEPGKMLALRAVAAPDAAAAAHYYPAIYWWSMLKVPEASEFPGTGDKGNGIPTSFRSQARWLAGIKTDGCVTCHQVGNLATRTIPKELGQFKSSYDAWARRVQSGQASNIMARNLGKLDTQRALKYFADWTDRIAAGELPKAKPQRPQGIERNIVVSVWDWGTPTMYLHDEISTDRRDPTVNANGPIYGSPEWSTDHVPVLDPVNYKAYDIKVPVRDPKTPSSKTDPMFAGSPYWGNEPIWDSQTTPHNPMLDDKGRAWFTSRIHGQPASAFCGKGSSHPSAKAFPVTKAGRQLSMYDPKTKTFTLVDTCFSTHHVQFDGKGRLWASSGVGGNGNGDVVGWLDVKKFDQTHDEQASQGWSPIVLDTNGNGKRDEWTEPNQPRDPNKDLRIVAGYYGIAPSPLDGSVWGSALGFPGRIVRYDPETQLGEVYEVPAPGYSPRGMDIDTQGVVWVPLASGHMGSFDRRKCKGPLNGPNATGKHCPEGWTLHRLPGPQFEMVSAPETGSAEASYFTWVDQHNVSGLGKDTPFATGNNSDALHALVNGKFVELRVPYPMGFFAKGMDGRIDDPNGGWKGRGIWSTTGNRTPFHLEGGKGTLPKVVKFQVRPDPLAH